MSFNIAIDGPAGAGKSTIAKQLAKELSFIYVDTGAMYRSMALYFMRNGIAKEDEAAISDACKTVEVSIAYENGEQQVLLNGENVSKEIRKEEVGKMASATSVYKEVRKKLVELQQKLAADKDVIMDGRDIGTCVLPNAQVKIYLTASVETRAERRYQELLEKGAACDLEVIKKDIADRDYQDMHREISPLKQAEDAILVDSSDMGIEEVVETIKNIYRENVNMKNVRVAKSAGFCFGVKRAVDMVYAQLETNDETKDGIKDPIYTYGPIIHNEEVVKDLEAKGVTVIHDISEIEESEKGTIVIRSHGVGEKIYQTLENAGYHIVDATCPFVKKIHRHVREYGDAGYHVVIIGNASHPEVEGIRGWGNEEEITVIGTREAAENFRVSAGKKVCIVSQTTFNYNKFQELVEIINKKGYDIIVLNTICNATEERQTQSRALAKEVEAMIVVGGKSSSNTQKLFEICKNECANTYYIQTIDDLDPAVLRTIDNVGITAGASTPNKIIEEVQNNVRNEF